MLINLQHSSLQNDWSEVIRSPSEGTRHDAGALVGIHDLCTDTLLVPNSQIAVQV